MKKVLIAALLLATKAHASYPELFGASFTTSSIGNQSNFDANDPSNNFYNPALLGFSENVNLLMQATSTATHFTPITNITITNSTNSNDPATTGNAKTGYPKFYGNNLHITLPVGAKEHLGTIGLSLFMPIGDLTKANTGDPFLPEYVMYQSRYQRTSAYLNFARKWSDSLSWSVGTILGFQATAEVQTNMSLNGAQYGSWAKGQVKVSPSIGAVVSVAKKLSDETTLSVTYSQEMKSNLKTSVYGEITNPSLPLINSTLATMMYYDPHTIRVLGAHKLGKFEFFGGAEYQMWSQYETPIMLVKKTSGVIVPSSDYEKIKTRDTINPRLGANYHVTNRFITSLGVQYRMTPLDGDFSGSGNSIDTNAIVGTAGLQYRMVMNSKDVHFGTSIQYHKLETKNVVKSDTQENGNAGPKIGAPGYEIGGYILAATFGVKVNF